jgi:hypothetical protein
VIILKLKRILSSSAISILLLLNLATPAIADVAPWTLNSSKPISFVCGGNTYNHTLNTVVPTGAGNFTGTGSWDNDPVNYTWDITGNIAGNNITFQIVYNNANSEYTLNGVGVIASDGSISGTVDNNCEAFSMPAGSATGASVNQVIGPPTDMNQCKNNGWMTFNNPTFKNQGDCVSYVQSSPKAKGNK